SSSPVGKKICGCLRRYSYNEVVPHFGAPTRNRLGPVRTAEGMEGSLRTPQRCGQLDHDFRRGDALQPVRPSTFLATPLACDQRIGSESPNRTSTRAVPFVSSARRRVPSASPSNLRQVAPIAAASASQSSSGSSVPDSRPYADSCWLRIAPYE